MPSSLVQYLLFFQSADEGNAPYSPVVSLADLQRLGEEGYGCLPYALDKDLIPLIPALWLCTLLPRRREDFYRWSPAGLCPTQDLDLGHQVTMVPLGISLPDWIIEIDGPTVSFYPDDRRDQAEPAHLSTQQPLSLVPLSSVGTGNTLIRELWNRIGEFWQMPEVADEECPFDPSRSDFGATVAAWWLYRWFRKNDDGLTFAELVDHGGPRRLCLKLLAQGAAINDAMQSPNDTPIPGELFIRAWHTFRSPLSVVLPGVSARYLSDIGLRRKPPGVSLTKECNDAQTSVMSFLGTHRAVARTGAVLQCDPLSTQAFGLLHMLEGVFGGLWSPNGHKVDKLLGRLSSVVADDLSEEAVFTLESASELIVFSEFPIGLVTVGSASAPLACSVPTAYRPVVPLTRAAQFELKPPGKHVLSPTVRVTVAECLPRTDRVGALSRSAWGVVLKAEWRDLVSLRVEECADVEDLRRAAAVEDTDILVISAHGYYDRSSNCAGLVCGNSLIIEQEIGPLPPLTILSACQVWPRSTSAADITSLLLRQGSLAVIGTLVPVDVRHNSRLMVRLLANIADALEGGSPHRTLQDVWHHTMATDAINCILNSNSRIAKWAHSGPYEESVLHEFKMLRSEGRLRRTHIFEDTEEVLLEIARDRKVEKKVRAWITRGYVKESLFYAVLGWPERIMLAPVAGTFGN